MPEAAAVELVEMESSVRAAVESTVEKLKKEGNDDFQANRLSSAISKYSEAIDQCGDVTSLYLDALYCNRALCQIKLENYGSAILDAESAIELNPKFAKAHYRRGCAHMCLMKYAEAKKDFEAVYKLNQDKNAQERIRECSKQLRQQRFAQAISTDQGQPMSQITDADSIVVESSYSGPSYDPNEAVPLDLQALIKYIKNGNVLHKKFAYKIVLDMIELLQKHETLSRIEVPADGEFTVCGDVHGQFYDLLNIFELNGMPSEKNPYLFNGDFVDRGSFSVECIITLFAAKLLYPKHVHLARGNHETRNMNRFYGFEGEVKEKYDENLHKLFCEAFCLLPLAHIINSKIFVVHGGLFSSDGVKLSDIENLDRNREPPDEGCMTEMLWSDPQPNLGRCPSKRGVACSFGPDVTKRFLEENGLDLVIRSHEMKENGYEVEHDGKLITVFSAPNYCDQMGNKGAFLRLNGKDLKPKFTTYEAVPHPDVKPMKYASSIFGMMGGMGGGMGGGGPIIAT